MCAQSNPKSESEGSSKTPWNETVAAQFEQMLSKTPAVFKAAVRAVITTEAEANARRRGVACVEEWDLVHAYLKESPPAFRSAIFKIALSVGIDMQRYLTRERVLKMQELGQTEAWDQVARHFHPDAAWFEWSVTTRCNLKCQYCYEGAGTESPDELTTEQALQIVRSLGQSARELNRPFVMLWTGGDPLLRADLFDLIACAREEGMMNSIATHGWFLTPKIAARLKELEVDQIIISVDSVDPELHDWLRSPGSHAKAMQGIANCKKVGLPVLAAAVATRYNWQEMSKIAHWAQEEGLFFFYRAMIRGGRAKSEELVIPEEDYKKLYFERNQEMDSKLTSGRGCEIALPSIFDLVPFPYTPSSEEERSYLEWGVGCQACRLNHGISVTGDLLPCIRFKLPLGNLLKESFVTISEKEIYRKIALRTDRGGICGSCKHLGFCGGGCLAEVFTLKGDPFAGWDRCRWVTGPTAA